MSSLLEGYAPSSYDEMMDTNGVVREHWRGIIKSLETLGLEQLSAKQKEIDWRLEDNGVTYNVYNDPNGMARPWRLDPIPFVMSASDWAATEAGVRQRSKLMNLIFKDIYGEQRLLKENIVPSEVIYRHGGFLREVFGLYAQVQNPLVLMGIDLARGPDGKMWVLSDRVQSPSGLGYAIENRLTINSSMQGICSDISIERLYTFFEHFKSTLQRLGGSGKHEPLNVLLSPGPHNETYFEQAFLSSFLGLTLVQGHDLLAKGGSLWLKSLKGLRRIDAVLRRVDETYCDPLELRSESKLGVAGLVQVLRKQGVVMANPLGSGVLENLGLHPFMPQLAHFFLDEELLLPQIATWWCGQERERDYVLEHLSELIIKTSDHMGIDDTMYVGWQLSEGELKSLRTKIMENPSHYVGQEEVKFATVPTLVEEKIQPRKAVVRAFSVATETGYEVMPGALVRVGNSEDSLMVSGQSGGSSKDLWVLSDTESMTQSMGGMIQSMSQIPQMNHFTLFKNRGAAENSLENIPSLRAENLFWLGRYLMRSIISIRMIRATLKSFLNATRYDHRGNSKVQEILAITLTHLSMTYPGFLDEEGRAMRNPTAEIWSVMASEMRVGSLSQVLAMLSGANTSTKNLLPLEAWKVHERFMREWKAFCAQEQPSGRVMITSLDELLLHLMAYKALIEEGLSTAQGLILYNLGARIERSLLLIVKARSMLSSVHDAFTEYEILETLLGTHESLNAYRAHYRSAIELPHVGEFLLLDMHSPKSLIREVYELLKELPKLPKFKHELYLSRYEEPIFEAYSLLRLTRIEQLCTLESNSVVRENMDAVLSKVANLLMRAANELSKTYFSHYDEQ